MHSSSTAARRSPSPTAALSTRALPEPASASSRHSASASVNRAIAASGRPSAALARPAATSASNRCASTASSSTTMRYPGGRVPIMSGSPTSANLARNAETHTWIWARAVAGGSRSQSASMSRSVETT